VAGFRRGPCLAFYQRLSVRAVLFGALGTALCCTAAGCARWRAGWGRSHETAARLTEQARQAEGRGDSRSAEILLTEAVRSDPTDCEARIQLSELLLEHGSLDAAEVHLKQVVNQTPDDPRGYVRLAEALFLKRDYGAADEVLTQALEMEPRHLNGLLLRGRLSEIQQRNDLAIQAYYELLAIEPTHVGARLRIASIHFRENRLEQAAPLLREIMGAIEATETQQTHAAWLLGMVYSRKGRWHDAAETLELALRGRNCQSAQAADWYQLAYAHYRAGNVEPAREANARALQLGPQHAGAQDLQIALGNSAGSAVSTAGAWQ
jgi:tetratricopeptide (TPR) repeat protein